MHMPPPIHGAAIVGQSIHDSKLINSIFDCIYINPSASKNVAEVGKVSFSKILFLFSNLIQIISTIIKEKPQLVYYTPTSDGFGIFRDALTLLFIKLLGKKTVLHFHNKGVKEFSQNKFTVLAYKAIFHKSKVILLANELYQDIENFAKKDNVFICPNGIMPTLNKSILRKVNNQSYRFLFLSNIIKNKGVINLLEACADLKRKGYIFKCDFVGKWSDIDEPLFNEIVKKLNLCDCVKAHGPKYGSEKDVYFRNADAFILPSYTEAFSLVLIEAMEYSLPCICTNVGGLPSLVQNNQTGFLIEPKRTDLLVKSMIKLMDNRNNGIKLGVNGREYFEKELTLSSFEKKLINILTTIIEND